MKKKKSPKKMLKKKKRFRLYYVSTYRTNISTANTFVLFANTYFNREKIFFIIWGGKYLCQNIRHGKTCCPVKLSKIKLIDL